MPDTGIKVNVSLMKMVANAGALLSARGKRNPAPALVCAAVLCFTGVAVLKSQSSTGCEGLTARPEQPKHMKHGHETAACSKQCSNGDCLVDMCFCHKGFNGTNCQHGAVPNCAAEKAQGIKAYLECTSYIPGFGTTRLAPEVAKLWSDFQTWEAGVWIADTGNSDRIQQHLGWYNNYAAVTDLLRKGFRLGKVLEVGCGPYTQSLTLISKVGVETLDSLTLMDPLMDIYLQKVRNTAYRNSTAIGGKPVVLVRAPAEEGVHTLQAEYFDTVIMMNVIEHVTNSITIMNGLYRLLKPGGILVFHEYNYADKPFIYDNGHPIKLHATTYDLLLRHFEPIYRRDFNHEGDYSHAMGVYFIGVKPAN